MELRFILLAIAVAFVWTPARAVSFDCRRVVTPDELAICSDPRLCEMDDLVAAAFDQARRMPDATAVVPLARDLLAERRTCKANKTCILSSQLAALEAFRDVGADVSAPAWMSALVITGGMTPTTTSLPVRIGQCASTQVADVTPRLPWPRADQRGF